MKFLFFSFIIILFIGNHDTSAQTNALKKASIKINLSGSVKDAKTSLPLQGASIYISDLKAGTTSDGGCNYILKNLPAGNYVIVIGYIGYKNVVKTISLIENTVSDLSLEISITEEN